MTPFHVQALLSIEKISYSFQNLKVSNVLVAETTYQMSEVLSFYKRERV